MIQTQEKAVPQGDLGDRVAPGAGTEGQRLEKALFNW